MILRSTLILCLLLQFAFSSAQTDNALGFISDIKVAKKSAETEDKLIFVHVYTSWEQTCKQEEKELFSDPEIVNYFTRQFISVDLDANKQWRDVAKLNDQLSYPSYLYLNAKGKLIHSIEGCADKQRLLRSAKVALKNPKKRSSKFRNDYSKYSKDPRYLRDYILFCDETEDYELADKLCDQYAKQIAKIDSLEWMDFVMRFVHEEKSKFFDLLKKNRSVFNATYGKPEIDQVFIDILMNKEMWKMYDPESERLFSRTRKRVNKNKLDISDDQLYVALANRVFDKSLVFKNDDGRSDLAVRILKDHSDQVKEELLPTIIASVAIQQNDKEILTKAKEEVFELITKQPSMTLHDMNSIILYKLGEEEESFKQVALAQKYAVATNQKYKSSLAIMKKSGMIK